MKKLFVADADFVMLYRHRNVYGSLNQIKKFKLDKKRVIFNRLCIYNKLEDNSIEPLKKLIQQDL